MSRPRFVIALAGLALALAAVPAMAAGGGGLTPLGCIDDNDTGADTCAQDADGLDEAQSVAVSPDGTSVYVAAQLDDAIVRFDRDPATGALTPQGCVDDNDATHGPDACAQSTDGLDVVSSVAVSPDGESVYAASLVDDAVARFDRDPATGALTPQGCIEDSDGAPDGCTPDADGLNGAFGVAVSPDGASVYVASVLDDAISRFDRDPATGALTGQGCVDDNDTGADTCAQTADGLDSPLNVVVSPDGESVYSSANGDDAIARFDRAPATGALTPQDCVDDNDPPAGADACGQTTDGLDGVRGIAISPDGRSVYGGANSDDAIVRLDRSPATGALTPQGCVDDNEDTASQGPDTCAQSADGLDGAIGVAVSSDGESAYVAAPSDDAVVRLDRAPATGALAPNGCIDDNDTGADTCAQSADGIDGVIAIEAAPGGESLYTAANSDDAVAMFAREPEDTDAPETRIDSGPTGLTDDSTPTFGFSSDEPGSTFECRVYPSGDPPPGFGACSGPGDEHTPGTLVDDGYVFESQATDPDGNADPTPASRTFTVDTTDPAAPSLQETHPASPANDNSPEIEGVAEEASTVSIYDNAICFGTPIDTGSAFELATVGVTVNVADNSQTSFSATATDGAGNVSDCSAPIAYVEDSTVPTPPAPDPPAAPGDTSAPDTLITSGPKRVSKRANTAFRFDSTEAGSSFQCRLDDGQFEPCTSPEEFKAAKGRHTFEVRATDAAGNTDPTPATQSWIVKKKKKKK